METRKLYYEDVLLGDFTAQVLECTAQQDGFDVILDATAFYPEGGGQGCDLGTLGGVAVTDVREKDGRIVHRCASALPVGGRVAGLVDMERRMELSRQHSGEHIVSGIICRRWGYHNVGFHMGQQVMTIDFDGPIPAEELPDIEAEANRVVWEDIPIRCWVPEPEELPKVAYRSKKFLAWPVRIVEIPGVDSCACCGTHVPSTGRIGVIKLLSCVKFHQGVRIEMACGGQALAILNGVYEQNKQVSQTFSAKIMETGAAARSMAQRLAAAEYRCGALQRKVFEGIAAGYAGKGNVAHWEPELNPNGQRELAERIADVCGGWAAVFSESESGCGVCMVNRAGDVKALGNALCAGLDGRGGGKPGYFQGNVKATPAAVETFLRTWSGE